MQSIGIAGGKLFFLMLYPNLTKKICSKKILTLLKDNMGLLDINPSYIKQCFRFGISLHSNKPRPTLVYFSDHETKFKIWNLKSKFKGPVTSVSEFLTRIRQSMYNEARRHFGVKHIYGHMTATFI